MEGKKTGALRRITDRCWGGLNMSWPAVLLLAVAAAAVTAVFLIVPIFRDTSFERMGVYVEAWIFLAVLIMANCKKPLESALKVFVFFLVSQPLIYLLQVPFSWQGWGLFGYYKTWFILTLLTFPAAFAGWYITKRNWLSVLILAPVIAYLVYILYGAAGTLLASFQRLLVTCLFCLGQIVLYLFAFMPKTAQKLAGAGVAAVTVIVLLLTVKPTPTDPSAQLTLPETPALTEDAGVFTDDPSLAEVQLLSNDPPRVQVVMHAAGSTEIVVQSGGEEFRYSLEIDEEGGTLIPEIEPLQ